tara:strand:- start:144 stop:539 length:396 start_codon:yes stop_codon:yes gene_type:complete
MWLRWLIIVCFLSIVTPSNAQGPNTQEIIHDSYGTHQRHENYKTEDILLLFKSCYETIYFLGNTKYKRSKKVLKEEDVSRQCFCICDKIRSMYKPREFLDRPPIDIHNIIKPLTAECITEQGQIWHDDEEK